MRPPRRLPGLAACALALLLTGSGAGAAPAPGQGEALPARLASTTTALDRLRGKLDPAAHAAVAAQVAALADEAPAHPRVRALQAWLSMNAHRFAEALALADQALAGDAAEPVALVLRADALTELGRYDEAESAVDVLGEGGARLPVVVRVAHLRRLRGDLASALELVGAALAATPPDDPDAAWLRREAATLAWQAGDEAAALDLLATLPAGNVETLVLRARIQESAGRRAEARESWRLAVARAPLPVALVGLWRSTDEAAEQRRLAHRLTGMARLDEAQGGLARRDFIEFFARAGQLPAAVDLARREYQRRPDVFSAGQLAWVLALAGQPDEAAARAREARRLGTRDRDLDAWVGPVPGETPAAAVAAGATEGR
jgi:tetratricopeptide (TPR) repeat protein